MPRPAKTNSELTKVNQKSSAKGITRACKINDEIDEKSVPGGTWNTKIEQKLLPGPIRNTPKASRAAPS